MSLDKDTGTADLTIRRLQHSHALVTVGYEADYPLLRLQARSLARSLDPGLFSSILVIDNSRFGFGPARRRALLRDYGRLAEKVRLVAPKQLGGVPRGTYGWTAQQVLKLEVGRTVEQERYLVLDAKNLLVNELSPGFLEDERGRSRVRAYSYLTHPLRPALERSLSFLGVAPEEHVGRFTATVTPFVLQTEVVRRLLDHLQTGGRDVMELFVAEKLTEFFLYSGWFLSREGSLDDAFDLSLERCPNVWPRQGIEELEKEVRESVTDRAPFFTVHQRALAGFDDDRSQTLARFWCEGGLFDSVASALAAIDTCRRTYVSAGRRWNRRPRLLVP
jgi:hypothetical protein